MTIDLKGVNARNIPKLPLEKAAAVLIEKGITKSADFYKQYKERKLPPVIPGDPKSFYTDYSGWRSFLKSGQAYLDHGNQVEIEIPTYDELKMMVRTYRISTRVAYTDAVKKGVLGDLAPLRPDNLYINDFSTWTAFLGKPNKGRFLTFEEAREKMKSLGIRNSVDWSELCSRGERPANLPHQPSIHYAGEWRGWKHFLSIQ